MGFTFLFCLDESSVANHINDRKLRTTEGLIVDEDAPPLKSSPSPQPAAAAKPVPDSGIIDGSYVL